MLKIIPVLLIVLIVSGSNPVLADSNTELPDNSNKSEFVSPECAFYSSFLPFWSGSWNSEFNFRGLIFQPPKILGASIIGVSVVTLGVMTYHHNDIPNDEKTSYYAFISTIGLISCLVYVPAALLDAFYSKNYAFEYNNRHTHNVKKSGIFFTLRPDMIVNDGKNENENLLKQSQLAVYFQCVI